MYDGEQFEHDGLTFRFDTEGDDDLTPPWKREDGHGPVSDWRSKESKAPGERILITDRGQAQFYDYREAVRIARKDGWGISEVARERLTERLRREPLPGDIAAQAAEDDFKRLAEWCKGIWGGGWGYIGVTVTLLDIDGEPTDRRASLWGIESDADDYLTEVAGELAEEILGEVGTAQVIREAREPRSWTIRES